MKRRNFLKAGLLAVLAIYAFPEKAACFVEKITRAGIRTAMSHYPFTGMHSTSLACDRLSMPDAFPRSLLRKDFIIFVPEPNSSALLIPMDSDEWKILAKMFDSGERDGRDYLRKCAEITDDGRLYLSDRVRKFAGIRTTNLTIIGHGRMIEIIDSRSLHSKKDQQSTRR